MAQITKSIKAAYGYTPHLIPQDILQGIDQAELLDRLVHSAELVRKSQAAIDPSIRVGYANLARATLVAQPRAKTERESNQMVMKAAAAPPAQAAAIRRAIQDLQERHPAAPRRAAAPVAKAKDAKPDMVAVFDAAGNLVGIVDPADITPVSGAASGKAKPAAQAAPQPAEPPAPGTPDQQIVKSLGPAWLPVHDWRGRLAGAVRRRDVIAQPPGGRVAKSAASSVANVYDSRRRLLGTAAMSAVVDLADLRAGRRR